MARVKQPPSSNPLIWSEEKSEKERKKKKTLTRSVLVLSKACDIMQQVITYLT
jgi:hypothetical protein